MKVFPHREHLPVRAPFRLDLTADALRRLATNSVDVVTPDGAYLRAFDVLGEIVAVRVTQVDGATLCVEHTGAASEGTLAIVARTLGTAVDLRSWTRNAGRVPWLASLERALRGVKPPRYPSLWEACVHAIVFQQISIHAASSIMRRLIAAIGTPISVDGVDLVPFPSPASLLAATDATLRSAGLSTNKVAHLRAVAEALARGEIHEEEIESLATVDAAERLTLLRGIGPWSAAVVLLRGFGRLDTFPLRDSGVARSAALLSGDSELNLDSVLEILGPVRGMLYYHLLLGRLRNLSSPQPD
ncbi:MAG TPA: DNA-3-methyladenine glycosylase 2 family protein [Verrucomicrobiae bacterium]|nr:DNA-3-methyladenine glycosylase 2 family protein [Verrucomicrobiae bacterium]